MRWIASLPFRHKLPLLIASLLAVAMLVISISAYSLLRVSMTQELDQRLLRETEQFSMAGNQLAHDQSSSGRPPSDYYVGVYDTSGTFRGSLNSQIDTDAAPDVPELGFDEIQQELGQPRTLTSVSGQSSWRAVPLLVESPAGVTIGWVWVALPMDPVSLALGDLAQIMALTGGAIVLTGALVGYLGVSRSLRGLRQVEETTELVAAGDLTARAPSYPMSTEVGRLSDAFNSMVGALQRSFARQEASEARMRQFVADASHELRTPLASIRGFGELYRMGAVPAEEVPPTFGRIEREAIRMGDLVEDLLALARLDEHQSLNLAEVDMTELAHEAATTLRSLDPDRMIQVDANGPVTVRADRNRLHQVLTNLVGNVHAHTPAGSPVELRITTAETTARVELIDHGPGIADEDSSRIFERFYRPDTSRARKSGGTGLGLAIVAAIVESHGGSITHRPTPGGGATLDLVLPVSGPPQGE